MRNEAQFALEPRRRRAERFKFEHNAVHVRSMLYDEPYNTLRPPKVRRKLLLSVHS